MDNISINRSEAIPNGQDALGSTWVVDHVVQSGMYQIYRINDEGNSIIPRGYPHKGISGAFTSRHRAGLALSTYLDQSWSKADASRLKSERAAQAKVERAAAQSKAEKAAKKLEAKEEDIG